MINLNVTNEELNVLLEQSYEARSIVIQKLEQASKIVCNPMSQDEVIRAACKGVVEVWYSRDRNNKIECIKLVRCIAMSINKDHVFDHVLAHLSGAKSFVETVANC